MTTPRADHVVSEVRETPAPAEERMWPEEQTWPQQPQPRPSKPSASPWRKIHIPDEERQRAAAAGLHRYVGAVQADAVPPARPAPLPVGARFSAPRTEPLPPPKPVAPPSRAQSREDMITRAPPHRERREARPEARRAAPPPVHGNPHFALTVGVIIAVSLAAAVGLSWVSTPALDGAAALRAEVLQRLSPQSQTQTQTAQQSTAEAPSATPPLSNSLSAIEVGPNRTAAPPAAATAQPIEVAP